ncbi:outer membrane protein assembly factor BamB family protein [Methylobacillus caricis]|uniref:outer membrane protein assembly factor BamB family protein n=1 Tax=Methylobacillus caricis TaxID=1971611 RepID=UPI00299E33A6|nr:PQQ-binding-like beta-propeller repeat protein [Methylobacillus caricis]
MADKPRWGILSAIDLVSGKMKWQLRTDDPLVGGILATAGEVLFMGEGHGHFNAYSAITGKVLWSDKLESGVNAPPITYQIDGVQYVGVAAGGNQIFGFKTGDEFKVYKLQ